MAVKEPLTIYGTHIIKASAAPTLDADSNICYEPGTQTYLVFTASRGAFQDRVWNDHHTHLGTLETRDADLDIWLEDAWYLDKPGSLVRVYPVGQDA